MFEGLGDGYYPNATLISIVQDNLNTHTPAALYEVFEPAEARRIISKLDFRYTPKHGSWLNMAEIEFAVLTSQCLDRRIGEGARHQRKTDLAASPDGRMVPRLACAGKLATIFMARGAPGGMVTLAN